MTRCEASPRDTSQRADAVNHPEGNIRETYEKGLAEGPTPSRHYLQRPPSRRDRHRRAHTRNILGSYNLTRCEASPRDTSLRADAVNHPEGNIRESYEKDLAEGPTPSRHYLPGPHHGGTDTVAPIPAIRRKTRLDTHLLQARYRNSVGETALKEEPTCNGLSNAGAWRRAHGE